MSKQAHVGQKVAKFLFCVHTLLEAGSAPVSIWEGANVPAYLRVTGKVSNRLSATGQLVENAAHICAARTNLLSAVGNTKYTVKIIIRGSYRKS